MVTAQEKQDVIKSLLSYKEFVKIRKLLGQNEEFKEMFTRFLEIDEKMKTCTLDFIYNHWQRGNSVETIFKFVAETGLVGP
mmetsp:Transcript_34610/g.33823  ORF Transcript_34610/g.33823 Transcript_34610/m.33823 type:complete len:81 (+) Transcript_34610:1690-1932(+)